MEDWIHIYDFLEDKKSKIGNGLTLFEDGQVSKTRVVEEDRYSLKIVNPR